MSSYSVKKLHIYYNNENQGNVYVSNTDFLYEVFDKIRGFIPVKNNKYGILLLGVNNILIDYISFEDEIPNKNIEINMGSRAIHTLPTNKKIHDMTYMTTIGIYYIVSKENLEKCSAILRMHGDALWSRRIQPTSTMKAEKDYRIKKSKYMKLLQEVITSKQICRELPSSAQSNQTNKPIPQPPSQVQTIQSQVGLTQATESMGPNNNENETNLEDKYPILTKLLDPIYSIDAIIF